MLCRHLDLPIYDDSVSPLVCSHCEEEMDSPGDHGIACRHGFGVVHRHNALRNAIARNVIKPAKLRFQAEAPLLIQNVNCRPADLLVYPATPAPAAPQPKPIAYDVTVRGSFTATAIHHAASSKAGAAELATRDKHTKLRNTLRTALRLPPDTPIPEQDWTFVPLAFDTLGAPSKQTRRFIELHAKRIAFRTSISFANAKTRIEQTLSYSIWSTTAQALLSRMPSLGVAHP